MQLTAVPLRRHWRHILWLLCLVAQFGPVWAADSLFSASPTLHVIKEPLLENDSTICSDHCRSHLSELNIFQTVVQTSAAEALSKERPLLASASVYRVPSEADLGPTPTPYMAEENAASAAVTTLDNSGSGGDKDALEDSTGDKVRPQGPRKGENSSETSIAESMASLRAPTSVHEPASSVTLSASSPQLSFLSDAFSEGASSTLSEDVSEDETKQVETTSTILSSTHFKLSSSSPSLEAENAIDLKTISALETISPLESFHPNHPLHNETSLEETLQANDTIEDCHFLSFEEWKKQKEEDALESGKNASNDTVETPALSNNSEKALSANVSSELVPHSHLSGENAEVPAPISSEDPGRTYKDKFNYASTDCAATIVKTNSKAKGANSILTENKDSYLLNQCSSTNKFVVIELCQDILVDLVVIGNFEFFSSMFKDIRVSVSDRFPTSTWKVLGDFQAQNLRDLQTFHIENPLIWARYLKLEMLTHFGHEFYCPISLVRVHGTTMMDEFKKETNEVYDSQLNSTDTSVLDESLASDGYEVDEMEGDDECRVVLPLLGLNEFLRDINSTEFCEIPDSGESESTSTKAVASAVTTQESIYKNMMKRLSLLETNATLSLLYVEEQSKLLSTAFSNLERRQSQKFSMIFEKFNGTIVNQLGAFRSGFKLIEADAHEKMRKNDAHFKALVDTYGLQLSMLSEELQFQKKISVFNTVIIVCLLVYVIVTRDAYIEAQALGEDAFSESPLPPEKKYGSKRTFSVPNSRFNRHSYGGKGRKKKRD